MEGVAYRKLDMEYWANRTAWLTMVAQSKKKSGKSMKYVFTRFLKLFNMDKQEARLRKGLKEQKTEALEEDDDDG